MVLLWISSIPEGQSLEFRQLDDMRDLEFLTCERISPPLWFFQGVLPGLARESEQDPRFLPFFRLPPPRNWRYWRGPLEPYL